MTPGHEQRRGADCWKGWGYQVEEGKGGITRTNVIA